MTGRLTGWICDTAGDWPQVRHVPVGGAGRLPGQPSAAEHGAAAAGDGRLRGLPVVLRGQKWSVCALLSAAAGDSFIVFIHCIHSLYSCKYTTNAISPGGAWDGELCHLHSYIAHTVGTYLSIKIKYKTREKDRHRRLRMLLTN